MNKYSSELEGQMDFLETYLPRIDKNLKPEDAQTYNTDGVINGNIIEFKLDISDVNATLFQAIKYLSSLRVKGVPVLKNILLVSLNASKAYLFDSGDYLKHIEKVYVGPSSKKNEGFIGGSAKKVLDYSSMADEQELIEILKSSFYTKIHLDENCIVGWAQSFYSKMPTARKADFIGDTSGKVHIIGEIRKPNVFRDYIYPYTKSSNERFAYLMDRLNDFLLKKDLGAFYTNPVYAKKSHELLRQAIQRVPAGNDYVILDRCAGTGNLEEMLTEEELSHTIVSTVEYYEYKVLLEKLGDKVLAVIPPTEKEETYQLGKVKGADALSEEYVNNPIIKRYVDNPKFTIIIFENPPYSDTTSIEHQKMNEGKNSSVWKDCFVVKQMKSEVSGTATNELGNAFIWSAFKYYLRQPTDSLIVYSPVKYWKVHSLVNKKFLSGFAFNRRHFHTNIDACVMCALWSNEDDFGTEVLEIDAFDISSDGTLLDCGTLPVKKIHERYSQRYFDKRIFPDDAEQGILCSKDGTERTSGNFSLKPVTNKNIIGYMAVYSSGFDNPDNMSSLLVAGRYDGHGFYLREDNFIEKLPMFCASRYVTYRKEWTERGRIMKSADGFERYEKSLKAGKLKDILKKCLIFTCLEPQNHIRSFVGSDGVHYFNQLCFDNSLFETLASKILTSIVASGCVLTDEEKTLLSEWDTILSLAKNTTGYKSENNYGLYQIKDELNTTTKDEKTNKTVYDYPELNGHIKTLAELVKDYYRKEIVPFLFEYEFLK